jgi:hypothetical protein
VEPAGPPDFDTRPAEPLRSTIRAWIRACPHCGYAADRLDDIMPGAREFVLSAAYQGLARSRQGCLAARPFLAHAALLEHIGAYGDAGWCALQAAWVCDDQENETAARAARARAIELWKRGKEHGVSFMGTVEEEFTIVADVYRRMGDFEQARIACTTALDHLDLDATLDATLRHQLVLIAREDTACHNMAELLQPPPGAVPVRF